MPVPVPAGKPFPRTREEREEYWRQFEKRNDQLGGNSQFIYPREEWQRVQDENARTIDKEFPPYGILLFLYGDHYKGTRGLFGPGKRFTQNAGKQSTARGSAIKSVNPFQSKQRSTTGKIKTRNSERERTRQ